MFDLTNETDKETTAMLLELTTTAIVGIITELEDEKKATYKYLYIWKGLLFLQIAVTRGRPPCWE